MPRYHFVVSNDLGKEADHDGLELPGDREAREWATEAVHEISAEDQNTDWTNWHVEVLDASSGHVVVRIPVGHAAPTKDEPGLH